MNEIVKVRERERERSEINITRGRSKASAAAFGSRKKNFRSILEWNNKSENVKKLNDLSGLVAVGERAAKLPWKFTHDDENVAMEIYVSHKMIKM